MVQGPMVGATMMTTPCIKSIPDNVVVRLPLKGEHDNVEGTQT